MATIIAHTLENPVSVTEESGVISSLKTTVLVHSITGSTVTGRLANAYSALDAGGYTSFSSTTEYPHLTLVGRDFQFLRNDPSKGEFTLEYKARGMGGLGAIGTFNARLSSSLQQIDTNFDIYQNQIVLYHTYPADDENYRNETKSVTATVPQLFPQGEIIYEGLTYLSNPLAFRNSYLGHINAFYWNGGEPGTWLCTEINITPHTWSTTLTLWYVTLSFQFDPSGWGQLAVFTDPTTNKPPVGLVDGLGVVSVQTQPYADFWEIIAG